MSSCRCPTCHVGGEGSVRSPAGVPAHNFTLGHQGALIRPAAYKAHRPDGNASGAAHLQEKKGENGQSVFLTS